MKKIFILLIVFLTLSAATTLSTHYFSKALMFEKPTTFWDYQCIDTMKYSRDSARSLSSDPNLSMIVDRQLSAIKDMGANCVAIGTPYNDEFIPFMSVWIKKAREKNLHVWFRGNFAEWEGWFNYPSFTTIQDHHKKTYDFITNHKNLFQDGDIFSPVIEPENGGSGDPRESSEKALEFNTFLVDSYINCKKAFNDSNKKVSCSYFPTNGDIGKDIISKETAQTIDMVTIDHYVNTSDEMVKYIETIHIADKVPVAIGEFGAPIPDINGDMDPQQQAVFVESVFKELYKHKDIVRSVNYWVLSAGSTALLNDDNTSRPVVDVIKKYYKPAIITGKITEKNGTPLQGVEISTADKIGTAVTDSNGIYRLLVPVEDTIIDIDSKGYVTTAKKITIATSGTYNEDITLQPFYQDLISQIKRFIANVLSMVTHNNSLKFFQN